MFFRTLILERFWLIFGSKMEACWNQNHSKINANFETLYFEKTLFFLWKNNVFSKNRSSKLASIFARFWCQHASIFLQKIHQNPFKNRSQDASIFRSIFASIFLRFSFDFGSQLGAMLTTFSLKIRRR